MDVTGASNLSTADLYAFAGLAMPAGAASGTVEAGPTMPALAMEAAAMATSQALVATLLEGMRGPGAAGLAASLASLSVLDPAAELARLTR